MAFSSSTQNFGWQWACISYFIVLILIRFGFCFLSIIFDRFSALFGRSNRKRCLDNSNNFTVFCSSRKHDSAHGKQSPSIHKHGKPIPASRPHPRHAAKPHLRASAVLGKAKSTTKNPPTTPLNDTLVDSQCTCAVFLNGQFVRGSRKPPTGYPPISAELEEQFSCDPAGIKHCLNRCVENVSEQLFIIWLDLYFTNHKV